VMPAFPHVADISSEDALTLERAAAILREALVDRRYGETELGAQVVAYLDALEYADAATNTLTAYEYVLGLFAVEHADLSLADLEPPQGGGVVRAFLDRHWRSSSAATKAHRLAIVRSFLTWLVGEGLLHANPAQNIRAPKPKRTVRSALTRDDIDALIASQPSLRDQAALMLLAYLGLRKDELRRLRLADIDLEARTIAIHGKGGHLDTIPIGFDHVYNALALYLRDRPGDEHLLYPNDASTRPMDPSTTHHWFKRCLERAGLSTEWSLHDLRHAAADALYRVTGDIVLAQQLLRHADVRTTRGYLHPGLDRLAAAMKQVEAEVVSSKDAQ
jgi:site-specific recombinase XerD